MPDQLNTISGSTGLVGAVDGVFVLEKSKRTSMESSRLQTAIRKIFVLQATQLQVIRDVLGTSYDELLI